MEFVQRYKFPVYIFAGFASAAAASLSSFNIHLFTVELL